MPNQMFTDGPFRIDQTFSLPSGSYGAVSGADFSEMSIVAPALIEPDQIHADAILSENAPQADGDND